MPSIPIYRQQLQTEGLRVPQAPRSIDASSGAAALGRAGMQAVDALDRIADRDATDEAFKLELQVRTEWQQHRSKLREQYRGDQADQYAEAARQWWDDTARRLGSETSPRVREKAGKVLGQYRLQQENDTLSFVEGEKSRAREINFRTLQDTIISEATQGVTPTNAAQRGAMTAAQIQRNAVEYAAKNGLDSSVGEAMARDQLGKFHAGMLFSLAQAPGGAAAAREYMTQFGGTLPMEVRTRLDNAIRGEEDNAFAKDFVSKHANKPLADQLAAAGSINDPERKAKVIQEVKNTHALLEASRREAEKGAADQAWQLVAQGKRVPEVVLQAMDGRERVQLQDHLRQRAEQAADRAKGKSVKTDWAVYEDVREKLAKGEPVRVSAYSTQIAPGDLEKLIDYKTRKEDPKKAPEVASTEQQISAYVAQMRLGGESNAQKRGKFTAAAQDLFNEHLKRTGKEPSFEERQKILDGLVTEVVLKKGIIWDDTAPAYTLPREQLRERTKADANVQSQASAKPKPGQTGFTVGQVYRDANGNRAVYQADGTWKPAP